MAITAGSTVVVSHSVSLIVLGACFSGCAFFTTSPETDDDVKKAFWDHETEFNKLRTMMMEEQNVCSVDSKRRGHHDSNGHKGRIDSDYSTVKNLGQSKISPDRVERYQELMKTAGVMRLWNESAHGSVHMAIGSPSRLKHICYNAGGNPPDYRLVPNTSGLSHVCCEISPDWYFLRENAYESDD